jgi:phosphoglycerate kinase
MGAETVVWNGPQGIFEDFRFRNGSVNLVKDLVERSRQGATTIVGGGDSVSAVGLVPGAEEVLSHLSTGGGASLELLEGKVLPGIDALSDAEDVLGA